MDRKGRRRGGKRDFSGDPGGPSTAGGFVVTASHADIRRAKEEARALRQTQWWQRQLDRGVCHYCQRTVPREELTMDHLVPIIRGGPSTRGNVVPACKVCNNKKKYLLPVEWEDFLNKD
jgi:hypothetical protein